MPAGVDEVEEGDPAEAAGLNARRKATAVPGDLVLGADTVVALDGEILGKPHDAAQAREFLARLSGRTHDVVGGIALAGRIEATAVEVTRVTFRALDDATLDAYVATGEWEGRAGGYAIQGRGGELVERIDGDYLNVVGLSLERLKTLLKP
jgi:septum formation protein